MNEITNIPDGIEVDEPPAEPTDADSTKVEEAQAVLAEDDAQEENDGGEAPDPED